MLWMFKNVQVPDQQLILVFRTAVYRSICCLYSSAIKDRQLPAEAMFFPRNIKGDVFWAVDFRLSVGLSAYI
jgi:hypothetical protein